MVENRLSFGASIYKVVFIIGKGMLELLVYFDALYYYSPSNGRWIRNDAYMNITSVGLEYVLPDTRVKYDFTAINLTLFG